MERKDLEKRIAEVSAIRDAIEKAHHLAWEAGWKNMQEVPRNHLLEAKWFFDKELGTLLVEQRDKEAAGK